MKLLMIDNYDSFTYNLVQYLGELGAHVVTHRNDAIDLAGIVDLAPDGIVLSPGPCTPDEAGVCLDVVRELAGQVPILGVCLGHQAIGQALGGRVVRARAVMHGKTSLMHHNDQGVFSGLDNPFQATRYHSLIVARDSLPDSLVETAWTAIDDAQPDQRDEIMGFRHRQWVLEGVQFHPESILTQHGHDLLQNFLNKINQNQSYERY
ncbi:MAG: aminodeoxychorismate/anthranilate synthase component II [Pseudomonadota bacterium]